MAAIANTFQTHQAKGIKENLVNVISNIEPEETPFMSNVSKGESKTTFKEWQQDTLDVRSASNQQIEGDDISSFPAIVPTTRVGNHTEIARKLILISDTEEVVDKAGRKSELSYQIALKSAALKRDQETSMLANKAADGGSSTTARVTAGMPAWVKTNVDKEASGVNPVYTTLPNDVRTDGTQRAFTETMLRTVMRLAFDAGGKPTLLSLGSFNKALVSETFSGIATTTLDIKEGPAAIIGAVDVYISDFGKLMIAPNLNQRARDAWFITPSGISVDYLRPYKVVELAKTGDAEKRMLVVEYVLRVMNEKQQGLVADLTTS